MKSVLIYTDGACRGNPGIGGWGAVLLYQDLCREIKGGINLTTNNQMELTAAIKALNLLKEPCKVDLYTDSRYLQQGISIWIVNWKRKNWLQVKNVDLWQALDQVVTKHQVTFHWVKAHNGNFYNERADKLANIAIDEMIASG